MAEKTKLVNVYAMGAGSMLTSAPVTGNVLNVRLTIPQIKECLYAKAKVEEIINGKTIPLTLSNYMMDNPEEEISVSSTPKSTSKTSGQTLSVDKFGKIIKAAPAVSNNKDYIKTTVVTNESNKKEKQEKQQEKHQ